MSEINQTVTTVDANEAERVIIRYPNLLEELRIRRNMIDYVLKAANVTGELLAAALVHGEKLSGYELACAARALNRPVEYIKSENAKIFDANNSDKEAFSGFREKLDSFTNLKRHVEKMGVKIGYWTESHYKNAISFYETVTSGNATPYAQYLLALDSINRADDLIGSDIQKANAAKQPPPRGIRKHLATASAL